MRRLLCLKWLDRVRRVPGDVSEFGVAFGGNSLVMALWLVENEPSKRLFAFDTFSGLPHGETDSGLAAGECDFGDSFPRAVAELPLGNVRIVRGRIEDTAAAFEHLRFCFAFVDLDLHLPTSGVAEWLTDRITPGGVIGFHDYPFSRCPGVARVVDHEIDRTKFVAVETTGDCIFLQRR